ncbi:MAG: leucyl aminopeptidase, partial [Alphaproteobacteria bacterium]|nr:leucyl aminopeptidase [Alphaproteobacteria bacterium]
MKITFAELSGEKSGAPKSGALVVGVGSKLALTTTAKELDDATNGVLSKTSSASRFSGKEGQSLEILAPGDLENSRVLLVGVGDGLSELDCENLGGRILTHMNKVGEKAAHIFVEFGNEDDAAAASSIAYGAQLASYRFDRYRTKEAADRKP